MSANQCNTMRNDNTESSDWHGFSSAVSHLLPASQIGGLRSALGKRPSYLLGEGHLEGSTGPRRVLHIPSTETVCAVSGYFRFNACSAPNRLRPAVEWSAQRMLGGSWGGGYCCLSRDLRESS